MAAGQYRRLLPRTRLEASLAVVAGYWLVCLLSYGRAFRVSLSPLGRVYCCVTYEHGFIRRGLLGTVFTALYGDRPPATRDLLVLQVHLLAVFVVVVGSGVWLGCLVYRQRFGVITVLLVGSGALLAASQFLPTLAVTPGYVDSILFALLLSCAGLAALQRILLASILATIGPLMHESFIYYWVPIVLATCAVEWRRNRFSWRRTSVLGLPVLTTLAVVAFSDRGAAATAVAGLGLGEPLTTTVTQQQFGQSLGDAFTSMALVLPSRSSQVLWALIVFAGPAFVSLTVYLVARRGQLRPIEWSAGIGAFIMPIAIIVVASDLSRFLVVSNFMVAIVILMLESVPREPPRHFVVSTAVVGLVVLASLLAPFVYMSIDAADAWQDGLLQLIPVDWG